MYVDEERRFPLDNPEADVDVKPPNTWIQRAVGRKKRILAKAIELTAQGHQVILSQSNAIGNNITLFTGGDSHIHTSENENEQRASNSENKEEFEEVQEHGPGEIPMIPENEHSEIESSTQSMEIDGSKPKTLNNTQNVKFQQYKQAQHYEKETGEIVRSEEDQSLTELKVEQSLVRSESSDDKSTSSDSSSSAETSSSGSSSSHLSFISF